MACSSLDYETTEARAAAFIATILGNLTLAFANSAEVGTSFFDARRFVFWSIFSAMAVIITILLTVDEAGALFQITAPPLPVPALTLLAGLPQAADSALGRSSRAYCHAHRGKPIRRITPEISHRRSNSNASFFD